MPPRKIRNLNCYVIGDEPGKVFSVRIGTKLDACDLELWAVSIPLVNLSKLSEVPEDAKKLGFTHTNIQAFFHDTPHHYLHVLVEPPPPPPPTLVLQCYIPGDDDTFLIEVNQSARVEALKDAIKAEKGDVLKKQGSKAFELWAVTIRVDGQFHENVAKFPFDDNQRLEPPDLLSQVFLAPLARDCIQILVQAQSPVAKPLTTPSVETMSTVRSKLFAKFHQIAPSSLAKRAEFRALQNTDKYYGCCRPGDREPDLPLMLLDPVFAKFFEESQAAVLTEADYQAAWSLRDAMCKFYDDETGRASALRHVLQQYGIITVATKVGSYRTSGHIDFNGRPVFIAGVNNELGLGGADPSVQALVYFERFCAVYQLWEEFLSYHPCFMMFVSGSLVGFGGCALTGRPIQQIFSILPLNFPELDGLAYDALARHLSALKTGVESLTTRYSSLPPPSQSDSFPGTPPQKHHYAFPYQPFFTSLSGSDEGQQVVLSYTEIIRSTENNTLLFAGDSAKGRLFIKFVRQYGREVHDFCVRHGLAPKLFGFEALPGGWFMVVMEHLDDTWTYLEHKETRREGLKDRVRSAIAQLHAEGFVHGDIRNANIMVKKSGGSEFMLVDFDWAGRAGEMDYPKLLNRDPSMGRPETARDCLPILQDHDNYMFNHLCCH